MPWKKVGAFDSPCGAGPVTEVEFKVLSVLLSAPGKPFSRHWLLAQVWGLSSSASGTPPARRRPEPSNAEVAITSLRRRFPGLIETAAERGAGWLVPRSRARRCRLLRYPDQPGPAWLPKD